MTTIEIFTRKDGQQATVGTRNGKYYVDFMDDHKEYKFYNAVINYLTNNGFDAVFGKKIIRTEV